MVHPHAICQNIKYGLKMQTTWKPQICCQRRKPKHLGGTTSLCTSNETPLVNNCSSRYPNKPSRLKLS